MRRGVSPRQPSIYIAEPMTPLRTAAVPCSASNDSSVTIGLLSVHFAMAAKTIASCRSQSCTYASFLQIGISDA